MIGWAQKVGKEHGVIPVIKRSSYLTIDITTLMSTLSCEWEGKYQSHKG